MGDASSRVGRGKEKKNKRDHANNRRSFDAEGIKREDFPSRDSLHQFPEQIGITYNFKGLWTLLLRSLTT